MSLEIGPDDVPFIRMGKHKIRLEKEEIDEKTRQKAIKELRETPEIYENSMKELKKLYTDDADLTVPIDREDFLVKYLRPCKFYADSAYEMTRKFYLFKNKYPSYCDNLLPTNSSKAICDGLICLQEARDDEDRRIMIIEAGAKWKPNECSIQDMFRSVQIALEAAMIEPRTQVNGAVVIFNMLGFSLSHVVYVTPSFAKMLLEWIQDCIPVRLKGIHIVNQPYIFNMVYALFKPFMREKLKKRLHFHGTNFDSLKKHIPAYALRQEFKGTMDLPEVPGNLLYELMLKYDDDFIYASTFGYKLKNNNQI